MLKSHRTNRDFDLSPLLETNNVATMIASLQLSEYYESVTSVLIDIPKIPYVLRHYNTIHKLTYRVVNRTYYFHKCCITTLILQLR